MKEEAIDKIGKYKRVEAGSKKSFGNFEADLVNKVSSYCTLKNIDRTKYITSLIEKDLENKIVTNDFIHVEKLYYFNLIGLLKQEFNEVKASEVKPISNLEEIHIVRRIPNNLDTWSNEYDTYCYEGNPNLHRGLYYYPRTFRNNGKVHFFFLMFSYNSKNKELIISRIPGNKLKLYLDPVVHKDFIEKMKEDLKFIEANYYDSEGNINSNALYETVGVNTIGVIASFSAYKKVFEKEREEGMTLYIPENDPEAFSSDMLGFEKMLKTLEKHIKPK